MTDHTQHPPERPTSLPPARTYYAVRGVPEPRVYERRADAMVPLYDHPEEATMKPFLSREAAAAYASGEPWEELHDRDLLRALRALEGFAIMPTLALRGSTLRFSVDAAAAPFVANFLRAWGWGTTVTVDRWLDGATSPPDSA